MKEITLNPMPYQEAALWDTTTPILGITAGKGSGKTFIIACCKALLLSSIHRGYEGLLALPTYGMFRRNVLPMFKRMNEELGLGIKELSSSSPGRITIDWGGVKSIIHLDVSIENFGRVNGMNLAWAIVDECDIARREQMKLFAEELVFRCRYPAPGQQAQIIFMGAPELNGFMGEYFMENPSPRKKLYQWSMLNNYMLSPDYKASILELIPESKREGWVYGRFMYNTDGLVYDEFDPVLNDTDLTIADTFEQEKIEVCWDINDGGTSVVLGVRRAHHFFIVDEWMAMKDTEAVISKVKQQHWAHRAVLSCDPASTQVFTYIHKSGLEHQIMKSAPEIEHRVTAVNLRFGTKSKFGSSPEHKRHLLINTKKCKVLNKCLKQQGYEKGAPQKGSKYWVEEAKTDISGPIDALGYLVFRHFPYNPKNPTRQITIRGFN